MKWKYMKDFWNKSRKYLLFFCFSCIGTLCDIFVLNLLSTKIKSSIILLSLLFMRMIGNNNLFQQVATTSYYYSYEISNILSYVIGVAVAFILSAKFAFKIKRDQMRDCVKDTIITHISGWVVQIALLFFLKYLGKNNNNFAWITENIAKGISILINGLLMLLSNIFIVFRERDSNQKIITIVKFLPRKRRNSKKKLRLRRLRNKKKASGTWWISTSLIYGCPFSYIERSFFICLIPSSRNHVTLPI